MYQIQSIALLIFVLFYFSFIRCCFFLFFGITLSFIKSEKHYWLNKKHKMSHCRNSSKIYSKNRRNRGEIDTSNTHRHDP